MRTIELNPISFLGSPNKKKFVLLRSKKADKDEQLLKDYIIPKIINHQNANHIQGVWGTLGYQSDKPIDWKGNLKCSNEGNDDFVRSTEIYKEIKHLKYMYPGLKEKGEIVEKCINLSNLDINMPPVFKLEEIPELRLDIFLDEDQGALAFYQLKKDKAKEEHIEFIQPQPTKDNTTKRDRLSYHFKIIPRKEIEPSKDFTNRYQLSHENSSHDFIVKVLIFKRKFKDQPLPTNSNDIIDIIEQDIEKASNNLFAKKHRLLIFNKRKHNFNRVKKGSIDPKKKTLFLLHGTFSSTKGSFEDAYPWIESLLNENVYEQIIAFDHPTLVDDAAENIKALFRQFTKSKIEPFTQNVDVIGISQGGLIAQYLANLPNGFMPIGYSLSGMINRYTHFRNRG